MRRLASASFILGLAVAPAAAQTGAGGVQPAPQYPWNQVVPTPPLGNSSNRIATTAFVAQAIAAGGGGGGGLPTIAGLTVLGNPASTTQLTTTIGPGGPNQVLTVDGSGTSLGFGTLGMASLPTIATGTVLGNVGASGPPAALTATQLTTLCNQFTRALAGCVPAAPAGTGITNFLREDGTWAAAGGGSLPTIADQTVLGNVSGAAATPTALTTAQLTALCNQFTSSLSGCVPVSTGGTVNFLRADGSWAAPPSGGGGAVACADLPAFTGDVTKALASCVTVLANIPSGTTAAGYIQFTNMSPPATALTGTARLYVDTAKTPSFKDDAGRVTIAVQPKAAVTNEFLTAVSATGTITSAQPGFSNLSGTVALSQLAPIGADSLLMNATGANIAPQAVAVPNCAAALIYTVSTHAWGCNTSVAGAGSNLANPVVNPEGTVWQLQNTSAYNATYAFDQWMAVSSLKTTVAVTGAASNGGPNLIRLTVASTVNLSTNNVVTIDGVVWSALTTNVNKVWTITVVDSTHIDLQGSSFAGSWVSGGTVRLHSVGVSQQVNLESGTPFGMRHTNVLLAPQRIGFVQFIESASVIGFRNQPITLSARVRRDASSPLCVAILNWTGTIDGITAGGGGDPFTSLNTCAATTFATGFTVCGTVNSAALVVNTLTTVSVTCTPSATMNNLAVAFWTDTTASNGSPVDITKVNINLGSTASTFVPLPISQEVARAQRYYQKSYDMNTAPATAQTNAGLKVVSVGPNNVAYGQVYTTITFQTLMRTPPSMRIWSYNGNADQVTRGDVAGTIDLSPKTGQAVWLGQTGFAVWNGCQPPSSQGNDDCPSVNPGVYGNVFFHYDAAARL